VADRPPAPLVGAVAELVAIADLAASLFKALAFGFFVGCGRWLLLVIGGVRVGADGVAFGVGVV
jgi:hypothetical protein